MIIELISYLFLILTERLKKKDTYYQPFNYQFLGQLQKKFSNI